MSGNFSLEIMEFLEILEKILSIAEILTEIFHNQYFKLHQLQRLDFTS